ncbi:PREDICTED: proteasome activator complex subunit 1-like, partial [Gekko japonicus]|uniref:Proteasome activator complex subunit 1 n=1 Tax=Gekko japonicus TaxID=146911 RepID=A0ABM1K5J5_GEKJA
MADTLHISPERQAQVESFRKNLCAQAEELVAQRFPEKIVELNNFLKDPELNVSDLISLRAELDIPVPDPKKDEERRKKKEKEDDGKKEKDSKKSDDEDKAPPCGPVAHNEKITALLNRVKPEIQGTKEKMNVISLWLQLQVPRIEDGNNFGVAVQVSACFGTPARSPPRCYTLGPGVNKHTRQWNAVSKTGLSPGT